MLSALLGGRPFSKVLGRMFAGVLMVLIFTPVPLEHFFNYVNPETIHPFFIVLLIVGTVTAMIWITSNKSVVYPILLFIVTIYSAQIIYHLARPNTDQETMKFALSNHLFAQDAAISSFAHAFHQTNTNIFVFLGGSGVGKSKMTGTVANYLAIPPWTRNMKVYRLSKLSQHQNAFFFNDIKRFFDPARRGSLASFVELHPDCAMSRCVVVFDDFHIYGATNPERAMKLVNYLEGYAAQHKNVVFIFNIEFTSIIDPLQIEAFHDSLLDLGDFGSDLYKLQLKQVSKSFVSHVSCFQKIKPSSYAIVPFASLNTHRVRSTGRGSWKNELSAATKKKLGTVIKESQLFSHNTFIDQKNCQENPTSCAVTKPHLHIFLSTEVVEAIVQSAFYVEKREDTAIGMRAIEKIWIPQIYHAIKTFYETQSTKHCKYGGYLSINLRRFDGSENGNLNANRTWEGDIVCECHDSIIWKWYILGMNYADTFNWQAYGPFVVNLRNCALALEKVAVYLTML